MVQAAAGTGAVRIGQPTSRIDGHLKVTGGARYGSDAPIAKTAYGYWKIADIALGRITAIDESAARSVPGILDIYTHKNIGGEATKPDKIFYDEGFVNTTIRLLADDCVQHDGQIVALVVATSFEAARDAAARLRISYATAQPTAGFDSPGTTSLTAEQAAQESGKREQEPLPKVGDEAQAFAGASVKIDQRYATPTQHHNPIELFTTTCSWEGRKLTVWESTQNVNGLRHGLAKQLDISADDVRVRSPFCGGGFGSRGFLSQRTAIVAIAAKRLGRPVRAEPTRDQCFTVTTHRAETRHHIRLGASREGKLVSLRHEGFEVTSRADNVKVGGVDASTRLYACPNIDSEVTMVKADRDTPSAMRAPPETPYIFALESAMDELSYAIGMDPVELRRLNDAKVEPIKGLPFTSRSLVQCLDRGAQAFGWSRRDPKPASMRDGDWLVGMGMASVVYPAYAAPSTARVTLSPNGSVKVQCGCNEIGTGLVTMIAMIASDRLGMPLDRIDVEVGDSDLPPATVAGGSRSTASVSACVDKACMEIRRRLLSAAAAGAGPFHGADPASLSLADGRVTGPGGRSQPIAQTSHGVLEAYAETVPEMGKPDAIKKLYAGQAENVGGATMKDRSQWSYGASFIEVRVHSRTREIRVPRIVGAYAVGRIINPKAVESQLMGGQIWGVSSALHEATEIDARLGKYTNDDLAEYLLPVNADIPSYEAIIVPEEDTRSSPLGVKGVGELGIVGMNAAVANAVFHATGTRIRDLPIRLEKLL